MIDVSLNDFLLFFHKIVFLLTPEFNFYQAIRGVVLRVISFATHSLLVVRMFASMNTVLLLW